MLDIQIAVAKVNKYATRESGDTVEVVERPQGGFTVVLADGQGSGKASKVISHLVTAKVVSLIKDGARDGAVARLAHDYLYMHRNGKVSATLNLCTVDLSTRTIVLSRNSHCPIIVYGPAPAGLQLSAEEAAPIGIYRNTKPVISEFPLEAGVWVVLFSDGILEAGRRNDKTLDLTQVMATIFDPDNFPISAGQVSEKLLAAAMDLDGGRPHDDMSVMVLSALEAHEMLQIRRMTVSVPIE